VRSEGGVIFLLSATHARTPSTPPARALIVGSAVNQNTRRKPMTAVDPVAQERVVAAACHDAGILPSALSAVELHGTGTKLGDPVELSALARATACADPNDPAASAGCTLTAAKMNFGHLESAAGALGLLKGCLMLSHRVVPPFTIDAPGLNPALEPLFQTSRLQLPYDGAGTPLAKGAFVGISSFGFAGNNAHVVLQMAPARGSDAEEAGNRAQQTGEAAALQATGALRHGDALIQNGGKRDATADDVSSAVQSLAREMGVAPPPIRTPFSQARKSSEMKPMLTSTPPDTRTSPTDLSTTLSPVVLSRMERLESTVSQISKSEKGGHAPVAHV
jgi:acyl transferase domain-containing protein